MRKLALIGAVLFLACSGISAADYKINSAKELADLKLKAGDNVILADGNWAGQALNFKANGSEKLPIRLTAQTPGKVKLTGSSSLKIDGSWLEVSGLLFTEGFLKDDDVVTFSKTSSNCRFTNSAIIDYNNPDDKVDYKWVSLYGDHNRVDHCYLKGKTHQGTTLVVWLSETPNYHRIDHNYFGFRPELERNGGETIRIGTSTWSFHDSFTTVENNVFNHCDGEIEAILNKSCKNIIRNNLFYECKATLTLRHGNDAQVYGNYFIGNNKPGTGGVRIICENHQVHDNYMQDLTGTSVSAAISVMAGLPNPILVSHWQVKNASIINNIIINCKEPFAIGAGYNAERNLPALNTTFAKNIIVTKGEPLRWYDDKVKINFRDNVLWGAPSFKPIDGFVVKDPKLQKNQYGLYDVAEKKQGKPFWKTEKTGPQWLQLDPENKDSH